MNSKKDKKIHLKIDGIKVSVLKGSSIMDAALKLSIDIPSLCHHPDLEPNGACRLCMVEIIKGSKRRLVTSCNYPVEENLKVLTESPAVLRQREFLLSLLIARCPEVEVLKNMAILWGMDKGTTDPLYPQDKLVKDNDNCILCGLCKRVCDSYSTGALFAVGRGGQKSYGTFKKIPFENCIACKACELICPTGKIKSSRNGTSLKIHDTEFNIPVMEVDKRKCIGCAMCEESCPFQIPRVMFSKTGTAISDINKEKCRGCGVCLAICPSKAIKPATFKPVLTCSASVKDCLLVYSCTRSYLDNFNCTSGDKIKIISLPCTGFVDFDLIVKNILDGAAGVLVMGRNQRTCRLNGAEDFAKIQVKKAKMLLNQMGENPKRIEFVQSGEGLYAPQKTINNFLEQQRDVLKNKTSIKSLNYSLFNNPHLIDNLSLLDITMKDILPPGYFNNLAECAKIFKKSDSEKLTAWVDIETKIQTNNLKVKKLLSNVGYKDIFVDEDAFRFEKDKNIGFSPRLRTQLLDNLIKAQKNNAQYFAVDDVTELVSYLLVTRRGTFNPVKIKPVHYLMLVKPKS